ncbi:hypothetical protein GCM10028787_07460 [Brachybacterium horti]
MRARRRGPAGSGEHRRVIPLGWGGADGADGADAAGGAGGAYASDGPVAGDARSGAAADGGDSAPTPARRRRAVRVWGGVALVLALVIAIPLVLMNPRTPERAAREYLDALVAGDAGVLKEHLAATPDASPVGLVDAVLQGAERRVAGYDVEGVRIAGDTATVTSTLTWSDGAKPATLALTAHAEGAGPLRARSWVLDPVALQSVSVGVPLGADHLEIGGVEVPLPEATEQVRSEAGAVVAEDPEAGVAALLQGDMTLANLQLPPGTYDVAAGSRGGLVQGIPRTIRTTLPGAPTPTRFPATLAMALTAEGEAEAEREVADLVARCAGSTSAVPEGCPFAIPGGSAAEQGGWEILSEPRSGNFTDAGGTSSWLMTTEEGGSARFTPQDASGRAETVAFPVRATVVLSPEGELAASWGTGEGPSGAICVDATTGEQGVTLENPEDPTVLVCG